MKKILIPALSAILLSSSVTIISAKDDIAAIAVETPNQTEFSKLLSEKKNPVELIKKIESYEGQGDNLDIFIELAEEAQRNNLQEILEKKVQVKWSYNEKVADEKIKEFEKEIPGYKIMHDGFIYYPRMDYSIYVPLKESANVSQRMKDYLDIIITEGENLTVGGLVKRISNTEVYQRLLKTREFLKKYGKENSTQVKIVTQLKNEYELWIFQTRIDEPPTLNLKDITELEEILKIEKAGISQDLKDFVKKVKTKVTNEKKQLVADEEVQKILRKYREKESLKEAIVHFGQEGMNVLQSFTSYYF